MEIIGRFLDPPVFFTILGVVFVVSVFTIRSIANLNKNIVQDNADESKRDKRRISELEAMVVDRDEEHRRKLTQAEEAGKSKEQDLRAMIVGLQEQLKAAQQASADVTGLQAQFKEKEEQLEKAASSNDELSRSIKSLQEEQAKLKNDLSLKTQMHEGLKGQYDELEKDVARLNKQLDEEKKRQAAASKPQPQVKPEEQQPQPSPKPEPQPVNPAEGAKQPYYTEPDSDSEP